MKPIFLLVLLYLLGVGLHHAMADVVPNADKILEAAELIRNPPLDYQMKARLIERKNDTAKPEEHTYDVLIKGRDKALVKFLKPAVDKGTKILFLESDMWIMMPSITAPLRIAPNQKLMGNAAYGDITRLNFLGSYRAKFVRRDTFQNTPVVVLDLTAIEGKPTTYERVEYWIAEKDNKPVKALYQTASGKVIREGLFQKYENVFGVKRPNRIRFIETGNPQHVTVLEFSGAKKSKFSDILFEKGNFARN